MADRATIVEGCSLTCALRVVPAGAALRLAPAHAAHAAHAVAVALGPGLRRGGAPWPALAPAPVPPGGLALDGAAGPVAVALFAHGDDVALYATGSRVRGGAGPASDLDLLALCRSGAAAERRWGGLALSLQGAAAFRAARAAGDPFAASVCAAHRRLSGARDPVGRAAAAFAQVPPRADRAAALAVARAVLRRDIRAALPGPAADKMLWAARMLVLVEGDDPFGAPPPATARLLALLARARSRPAARPGAAAAFRAFLAARAPETAASDPRPCSVLLADLAAAGGLPARLAAALVATLAAGPANPRHARCQSGPTPAACPPRHAAAPPPAPGRPAAAAYADLI